MAQDKLRTHHSKRQLILAGLASLVALLPLGLLGCVHAQDNKSMGMTLLFLNKGHHNIGVVRFDPDGQLGPVPGALGAGAGIKDSEHGKQMSFMPGDSQRGVPQFVEVEWSGGAEGLDAWWAKNITNRTDKYSEKWNEDYKNAMSKVPIFKKRIDLTPIITPELLAQVRADRRSTNLKLTVVFKDADVSVIAETETWRKDKDKYTKSDVSPEALAWGREQYAIAQEINRKAFFAHGYYTGQVSGALSGTLTLSVRTDATVSAVINTAAGPAFVMNGGYDITSSDAVRTLKLSGNTNLGATTLTGQINLKAGTVQGEWAVSSSASGTANPGGSFTAKR